jgi:hypothetical protein
MLIGYLFFDLVVCQDTDPSAPHLQGIDLGSESADPKWACHGCPHFLEMDLQHLLDGCPSVFGWISHIANSLKDDMNPRFLMAIRSFDRFLLDMPMGSLNSWTSGLQGL